MHGSGCVFSAMITGLLALGENPVEAVRKSKNIAWDFSAGVSANRFMRIAVIRNSIPTPIASRACMVVRSISSRK